MTNTTRKAVFEKVSPFTVAQARAQFFKDNIQYLYTRKAEASVKRAVKNLMSVDDFAYVRTESLFEMIAADVLESEFKNIKRAEDAGYVNAMGYDILDTTENIYVELKDYSVSMRGGEASPKLSAMVSNLGNKFCSVLALVIDPYLLDESKYQLYLIPADAIPADTSNEIDITHHKLIKTEKGTMYEQYARLGGAFSKYRIESLEDLHKHEDRLRSINVKKLAKVIRDLEASVVINETQKLELENLKVLFTNTIRAGNRKLVGKNKLPLEYTNKVYDITAKDNSRIFFDGARITIEGELQREAEKPAPKPRVAVKPMTDTAANKPQNKRSNKAKTK